MFVARLGTEFVNRTEAAEDKKTRNELTKWSYYVSLQKTCSSHVAKLYTGCTKIVKKILSTLT